MLDMLSEYFRTTQEIQFLIGDKKHVIQGEKDFLNALLNQPPTEDNWLNRNQALEKINRKLVKEASVRQNRILKEGILTVASCGLTRIPNSLMNYIGKNATKIKIINLENNYLTMVPEKFLNLPFLEKVILNKNYMDVDEIHNVFDKNDAIIVLGNHQHKLQLKAPMHEVNANGKSYTPQKQAGHQGEKSVETQSEPLVTKDNGCRLFLNIVGGV